MIALLLGACAALQAAEVQASYQGGTTCAPVGRTEPGCLPIARCWTDGLVWYVAGDGEPDTVCRPWDDRCIAASAAEAAAAACP